MSLQYGICLSWRATDLCLGGFEVKNNTEALNCNVQSTDVKKEDTKGVTRSYHLDRQYNDQKKNDKQR